MLLEIDSNELTILTQLMEDKRRERKLRRDLVCKCLDDLLEKLKKAQDCVSWIEHQERDE